MQAKLHRWAAADAGRRFDDLFNLVHDPATLRVAWDRVGGASRWAAPVPRSRCHRGGALPPGYGR
jgi:hypothetical protein